MSDYHLNCDDSTEARLSCINFTTNKRGKRIVQCSTWLSHVQISGELNQIVSGKLTMLWLRFIYSINNFQMTMSIGFVPLMDIKMGVDHYLLYAVFILLLLSCNL